MFEDLENLYKKKANYVKNSLLIIESLILAYATIGIIFYIFKIKLNLLSSIMVSVSVLPLAIILMIIIGMIQHKIKPSKNIKKIIFNILKEKDESIDIKTIKSYLKKKKLYNKEIIESMINHYRNKMNNTSSGNNYFVILGLLIAIFAIIKDANYQVVLLILSPIMAVVISVIIYICKIIWLVFKKEESMYENLEEILCTIYAELINCTKKTKW